MRKPERHVARAVVGRWVGAIGLLVAVTPRLSVGQQSAVVHATVRVVVSVATENRALVTELARALGRRRAELLKAQGSLARVWLAFAPPPRSVAPTKPIALVEIQYLRN